MSVGFPSNSPQVNDVRKHAILGLRQYRADAGFAFQSCTLGVCPVSLTLGRGQVSGRGIAVGHNESGVLDCDLDTHEREICSSSRAITCNRWFDRSGSRAPSIQHSSRADAVKASPPCYRAAPPLQSMCCLHPELQSMGMPTYTR
eukprot:156983-Pelagomonas_calceolata.AAC.1